MILHLQGREMSSVNIMFIKHFSSMIKIRNCTYWVITQIGGPRHTATTAKNLGATVDVCGPP